MNKQVNTLKPIEDVFKDIKIKTHFSKEIYDKIEYLCKTISDVEWSGFILYEPEGTIKDLRNFSIHIKDVVLMAKSSAAYTDFKTTEPRRDGVNIDRHIQYCENNPEAMKWKTGLIHSHNKMGTFFSGTDIDEIVENSEAHNYYLSIITNNRMELIGKIAIRAKYKNDLNIPYIAIDEEGKEYEIFREDTSLINTKVFLIDIDPVLPEKKENKFDEFFLKNLESVVSLEEKKYQKRNPYFMKEYEEDFYPQYPYYSGKKTISPFNKDLIKEKTNSKIGNSVSKIEIQQNIKESFFKSLLEKYFYDQNIRFAPFLSKGDLKNFLESKDKIVNYKPKKLAEIFPKVYSTFFEKSPVYQQIIIDDIQDIAKYLETPFLYAALIEMELQIFS